MKNPLLMKLIDESREKATTKQSLPTSNAANRIAAHLLKRVPDLCAIPGLWFSGSNVWTFLYGQEPSADADIDVFVLVPKSGDLDEIMLDRRVALCDRLDIPPEDRTFSKILTGPEEDLYMQGVKALYKGSKLDIWEGWTTPQDAIRQYPHRTHAHCRAAFSFTDGLIVLPNEVAS